MLRTTSSHHRTADLDLSPPAALRMLRSVAYREWDVYRAPAEMPAADEMSDLFPDPVVSFDSAAPLVGESDESEVYAPTRVIDLTDGSGNWYLNEVPAEWIEDSPPDAQPFTPISA